MSIPPSLFREDATGILFSGNIRQHTLRSQPPILCRKSIRLTTEIQIDWNDLDAFGHVNNLAILRYVQTSRIHVCEEGGLMKGSEPPDQRPILAATGCRYLRPLYYPGVVRVGSEVTEVKHTIYDEAGQHAATAEDVLVYFDYGNALKMQIPEVLRDRLSA